MKTETAKEPAWIQPGADLHLFADAADIAASIHGSLRVEDILRGCAQVLGRHCRVQRICLVQHRASNSAVTLYSIDTGLTCPMVNIKIIALEPSRLRSYLLKPLEPAVYAGCDPDSVEKQHFLTSEWGAGGILYWPLRLRGQLKGILIITLSRAESLAAPQFYFLEYLAGHLALAIANADNHYRERRRGRQLEMVSEIAKRAVALENLEQFLGQASELLRDGFDYAGVQIWTIDPRQELALRGNAQKNRCRTMAGPEIPPFVTECQRQNRILCDNACPGTDGVPAGSHLAVPIRLRERFLGVLWLQSNRLDAFPAEDLGIMEGVASLIASAFDSLRAFADARQSNEYMQAILESAKDRTILSTDIHGYVITCSAGAQAVFHLSPQEIIGRDVLTLFNDTPAQRKIGRFIAASDCSTLDSRIVQTIGETKYYLDCTLQCVHDVEKRHIGFLCIVRDVTEHVMLQERLEVLSITDELTGIYNQRRFFAAVAEEVERNRRFQRKFSLCFFDLDGFKGFNDCHGHMRGDQALRETAGLLRSLVRSNVDTCYRYGGDEFAIIMPETPGKNARIVVERIRAKLSERFHGRLTASIGVAEFSNSLTPEELIDRSDRAMYYAKSLGGNRVYLACGY